MKARSGFWFRAAVGVFAGILTLQAAWLLLAESIRPALPYFPQPRATQDASAGAARSEMAAWIGWLRGQLWTDAALAASAGQIYLPPPTSEDRRQVAIKEDAKAMAQRSARWSPHDARAWLLLAALNSGTGPGDEQVNRVRMSYFTGPNERELAPLRLRLATRLSAATDSDVQALVAKDIGSALTEGQREVVADAYRGASPSGKQVIEGTLAKLDPNFLQTLRPPAARR